jgi:hypothetical protein
MTLDLARRTLAKRIVGGKSLKGTLIRDQRSEQ